MKKLSLLIFLAGFLSFAKATNYADYVNPLVGTQSTFELSTGNTYPAIARPWGMNFWSPQTGKMGDGWMYQYTATKIRGFKQTPPAQSVDKRLRTVLHHADGKQTGIQ